MINIWQQLLCDFKCPLSVIYRGSYRQVMATRTKQIFAITCLTLHRGDDMKSEAHAVIGANHQSAAQKENHYDHHEKIFHRAREGLLRVKGTKVSVWEKGPGRLLTDFTFTTHLRVKHGRIFHFLDGGQYNCLLIIVTM